MARGRKKTYTDGFRRTSLCLHQPDWDYLEKMAASHPKLVPTRLLSMCVTHCVREMKLRHMKVEEHEGTYKFV